MFPMILFLMLFRISFKGCSAAYSVKITLTEPSLNGDVICEVMSSNQPHSRIVVYSDAIVTVNLMTYDTVNKKPYPGNRFINSIKNGSIDYNETTYHLQFALTNVDKELVGIYKANVDEDPFTETDSMGAAVLKVLYIPQPMTAVKISDSCKNPMENVTLTCMVSYETSNTTMLDWQCSPQAQMVFMGHNVRTSIAQSSNITGYNYTLYNTSRSVTVTVQSLPQRQEVVCSCTASDDLLPNPLQTNYTLCFLGPPFITTNTSNLRVAEGSSVNLSCSAIGSPVPTVQIFKSTQNSGSMFNSTALLTLQSVQISDTGWYTCLAESTAGNARNQTFYLTVTSVPDTTTSPVSGKVLLKATCEVRVIGNVTLNNSTTEALNMTINNTFYGTVDAVGSQGSIMLTKARKGSILCEFNISVMLVDSSAVNTARSIIKNKVIEIVKSGKLGTFTLDTSYLIFDGAKQDLSESKDKEKDCGTIECWLLVVIVCALVICGAIIVICCCWWKKPHPARDEETSILCALCMCTKYSSDRTPPPTNKLFTCCQRFQPNHVDNYLIGMSVKYEHQNHKEACQPKNISSLPFLCCKEVSFSEATRLCCACCSTIIEDEVDDVDGTDGRKSGSNILGSQSSIYNAKTRHKLFCGICLNPASIHPIENNEMRPETSGSIVTKTNVVANVPEENEMNVRKDHSDSDSGVKSNLPGQLPSIDSSVNKTKKKQKKRKSVANQVPKSDQ